MKVKSILLLSCLLLWWPSSIRAQGCRVIHSENLGLPSETILFPNEVAQLGGMTGTITGQVANVFDYNGNSVGVPSHNLNATAGGTKIVWNVTSNNATSATLFVYANGTLIGQYPEPLNGSAGTWTLGPANLGDTYSLLYKVENSDGRPTTQDLVTLYVSSGNTPGIISQDDFPTNYYLQLKNNFNGTTSMNFEYCPGAATATHDAPFFGSITNPTSSNTQSFDTSIAFRPNGGYNEEVPPTYVSFLPGDKPPQTSTTGRVHCSIAGDFVGVIAATGDSTKNQRIDKKMWTKVKIASSVQASDGGWYVDEWCIEYPPNLPIWAPNEIYTDLAPLNQYYWTAQTCSSSPLGTDPGPGWHCPGISGGPGPAAPERFFPSFSGVKGSCNTNVNTPAPY